MSYLISLHFQKLARPWLKYNNHNRNSNTGKFRVYVAPYKVAANEFNLVYHAICVPGSSAMFRVIGIASLAYAKIEIRAMDHDVQEVTQKNFDSVVSKFRDSQIASVFFFKPNDKEETFTMSGLRFFRKNYSRS